MQKLSYNLTSIVKIKININWILSQAKNRRTKSIVIFYSKYSTQINLVSARVLILQAPSN